MLDKVIELIRLTATTLSPEVLTALKTAQSKEVNSDAVYEIYNQFLENADLAVENSLPLCQDSGLPYFKVMLPSDVSPLPIKKILDRAVKQATKLSYLRPNAVDTFNDINVGTGIGRGIPQIDIFNWVKPKIEIGLMLKGGGSENVGLQYSLPNTELKAERDLAGVTKCVIDAVYQAQGNACPPYFLGVGIGGDRASSMKLAKEQFWRRLNDTHPKLKNLENDILQKVNQLGIGPMGVGGRTTVLSVKADYLDRIPASYFVSVSFTCWAFRRRWLVIEGNECRYV